MLWGGGGTQVESDNRHCRLFGVEASSNLSQRQVGDQNRRLHVNYRQGHAGKQEQESRCSVCKPARVAGLLVIGCILQTAKGHPARYGAFWGLWRVQEWHRIAVPLDWRRPKQRWLPPCPAMPSSGPSPPWRIAGASAAIAQMAADHSFSAPFLADSPDQIRLDQVAIPCSRNPTLWPLFMCD